MIRNDWPYVDSIIELIGDSIADSPRGADPRDIAQRVSERPQLDRLLALGQQILDPSDDDVATLAIAMYKSKPGSLSWGMLASAHQYSWECMAREAFRHLARSLDDD